MEGDASACEPRHSYPHSIDKKDGTQSQWWHGELWEGHGSPPPHQPVAPALTGKQLKEAGQAQAVREYSRASCLPAHSLATLPDPLSQGLLWLNLAR